MRDLVGQTLGTFRIEAPIGHGTLGDVYRGAHVFRAQRVAIKVLHPAITSLPGFATRFHTTLTTIAPLSHPHLLRILDFAEQERFFYVVTDLVTAGSLEDLRRQNGSSQPLPLDLALSLAQQAIEGVAHAHADGIAHENIKPSNLLLDHAPPTHDHHIREQAYGPFDVKVADLGLTRLAAAANALTSVGIALGTGVMRGAPAYMSPEQCRGLPLDLRSDVYALGLVLFELLTGTPPFETGSLMEAVHAHVQLVPPRPTELNTQIPRAVERVVLCCLAKDPDQRYADAGELAQALRSATPAP